MELANCTFKFQFQCPRHWESLRETNDPGIRICDSCLESVRICRNRDELDRASVRGECVAIGFDDPNTPRLLGRILPDTKPGKIVI